MELDLIQSPGDLESLDGFAFVAGDPLVGTCDELDAEDEAEVAQTLIDAGSTLVSLGLKSDVDTKRRALRAMTLGTFARMWRARQLQGGRAAPSRPELAPLLPRACRRLAAHLVPLIAARRPPPLELPRLKDVRVGVLRRRLDNFAPSHARHLSAAFAFVEHGLPLASWVQVGPSLGLPGDVREHFQKLVGEVQAAEDASAAPRRQRAAEVAEQVAAAGAGAHEGMAAALALVEAQGDAPPPLEVMHPHASASYDVARMQLTVQCQHYLACLQSSSCTTAHIDLSEPLGPKLGCSQRDTPCTLKRYAAERYVEALAGLPPVVPIHELAPLRRWCLGSASERLLERLDDLDKALAEVEGDEGAVGWLLTPFERLDLVRLTTKKKGGLKAKRLTQAEAEDALTRPAHVIAAAILRGQRMFQDKRLGYEGLEALGPVLAALAGDDAVHVMFEGEVRPLAIALAEPRLEALLDGEGRAEFAVVLGGRRVERASAGRSWASHFDLQAGTLVLGHVTEAMRRAAQALLGRPAAQVAPEDKERFAEKLLALDKRVPVISDKSWLGELVPPEPKWQVRLVWSGAVARAADGRGGRALEAELRIQVVPELGAMRVGDGDKVLPLKRVGPDGVARLKHVERDFDAERRAAIALAESLDLGWPGTAADFEWRFVALEEALAFVSTAQQHAASGRIELVWDSKPVHIAHGHTTERLQLRVGSRRDWLDLGGGYLLDGGELPLEALLNALRDQKRFVALDDTRFVELHEDLRKQLAPLASLARQGTARGERGGRITTSLLATPLLDELVEAGVDLDAPQEWLALRDRMHEAATLVPAVPAGVDAELRPYQIDGFRWIARLAHWARGAVLADDMGLGKTLQALVFMLHRAALGPTLVVAPTSVVANWVREAARFTPALKVRRVMQGAAIEGAMAELGAGRGEPGDAAPAGAGTVLVTTWDLLARYERLHGVVPESPGTAAVPWATVVLDEAHAMKNAGTRRAQAGRALEAKFVLALTGTPVENRPLELWSLMAAVAPGLLGSLEAFREGFGRDFETHTPDAARRLSRLIRPFLLRRTKAEVAPDLPAKSEVRVDVVLSGDERERYQRVRMAAVKELDALGPEAIAGQIGLMRVLAVLTRLRQMACHPRLVDPKAPASSAKLDRLVELADELRGEGRKMLVFSQFTELLGLVADAFAAAELSFAYLDGSTPGEERVREIDRFQRGEVDAFLLSLKAGGVGLNLTTASEVIHLDPWWNPAAEDQASDRAHRIGQDKPVTVYRLVSVGTIEEQILSLHGDKREMVSGLLAGTGSARALSAEDLGALLTGVDVEGDDATQT